RSHMKTSPTVITMQRPELRPMCRVTQEQVVAYFTHIAEDVRRIMASLGVRRMDDLVGRVELLRRIDRPENPRARLLDLSALLSARARESEPPRRMVERNVRPGLVSLDDEILQRKHGAPRPLPIGSHHLTMSARIR